MVSLTQRLGFYAQLMRWHRPIGALLLLWPTLWALWFAAAGRPQPYVVAVFVLGVVLMRSAGCVINDYADRNLDAHVERTRERPLAAGRVTEREALILFALLCLAAFALVLTLNGLTILLSFVAVFLAVTYPFLKRYTYLPQFYLGATFGWAIPMAFAAHSEAGRSFISAVPPLAWVVFAANVFWATAYDTAYAMVDRDDDIRAGMKSTAILFGAYARVWIGLFHGATLALLVLAGIMSARGLVYYLGLAVAMGFVAYQQWLMRERTREGCFKAFLNNNRFGAVIFLGLLLDYCRDGMI